MGRDIAGVSSLVSRLADRMQSEVGSKEGVEKLTEIA